MAVLEGDNDKREETPSLKNTEEDLEEPVLPTPPDGGWGWVIVFASFMIHVFADGFTYTFGIFYVHILNYYGASKSAASWIASILVGVTLGSGPISGTLVNHFGCRFVTIIGAILASVSIFVSVFADSVVLLYLTIGLGTGLGFGLIYLPAIVSVTSYFEKKRSFATGIAVCGSGLGTFAFSPITEHLIEIYSWKGALIIISGIVLNCVVFGALFRPLELEVVPQNVTELTRKENGITSEEELHILPKENDVSLADIPQIQISGSPTITPQNVNEGEMPRNSSQGCLDSRLRQLNKVQGEARLFSSQPLLPQSQKPTNNPFESQELHGGIRKKSLSGSGLLNRSDIFYRGSLLNIEKYKQDPVGYRHSIIRTTETQEGEDLDAKTTVCGCIPCSLETKATLTSLMDWSLLSDRIFLLFSLSNFCTSIGFNAPYIFTVDRALEMGIDSDRASYLLSVVGISNTVSRVVLGYISDKSWVNRLYLYNAALTACGVGTCISIWFTTFWGQVIYAAIFGSMSGAYVGLTSVVLVDLLGMEKLTNAFGVLLMFQGIASLIGPPLCGALYDMSKSYDYSFLLAGFMIAISGMMLVFIPCAKRAQTRRDVKKMALQYNRA